MQDIGIHAIRMEMGQRTVEGLFDLGREIGGGIIRSAMILAVGRSKFGL